MTLVKTNPRNLNNVFDDFFYNFPYNWGRDNHPATFSAPAVNIHETNEGYHLEMNAPGRNKEDFKISVDNGLLTVQYETKQENETKEYKTLRREFTYKSFKRSFTLDEKVNAEGIQAKYDNGILKLFVPKKEEVKQEPKQISIQ